MEIINLFIFIIFTYILKFFNWYQLVFYFLIFCISLQSFINENPNIVNDFVEVTDNYKMRIYKYSEENKILNYSIIVLNKMNDLFVKGRDIVVYFIGRNFINTFAPKEIATLMLDENIHQLMNPAFDSSNKNVMHHKVESIPKETLHIESNQKKVFNNDVEMFNFLENLK